MLPSAAPVRGKQSASIVGFTSLERTHPNPPTNKPSGNALRVSEFQFFLIQLALQPSSARNFRRTPLASIKFAADQARLLTFEREMEREMNKNMAPLSCTLAPLERNVILGEGDE